MTDSDKRYRQKKGAEAYSEILKRSYEKHKEERLAAIRRRANERMKTDPAFKLKEQCRKRVYDALRGRGRKSARTVELIGCDWDSLKAHLESQFQEGMSWDNYGKSGWEVDHRRPCASFDLTDPEQQRECFNYTNLQPLWSKQNSSKGSLFNNKRYTHADHVNTTESSF